MESPKQVLPQAPFIAINKSLPESTNISNVTGFFSNKKNIAIIIVIVTSCIFTAYKMKYLDFLFKKEKKNKEEKIESFEKTNENSNLNILDLEKDYHINDENNAPMKINLKEMIALHKHYIEQKMIYQQQQMMQQPMMQQPMMQQPMMQQQQRPMMQQQPQSTLKQQPPQKQQKIKKLKHSKKIEIISSEESVSEEQLSTNDLEDLKQELAELEKQNNNI
jgi:hypothetical protein